MVGKDYPQVVYSLVHAAYVQPQARRHRCDADSSELTSWTLMAVLGVVVIEDYFEISVSLIQQPHEKILEHPDQESRMVVHLQPSTVQQWPTIPDRSDPTLHHDL